MGNEIGVQYRDCAWRCSEASLGERSAVGIGPFLATHGRSAVFAVLLVLLPCRDIVWPAAAQDFSLNRRYDQYTYLASHNSFANDEEDYLSLVANQSESILEQLNGGVRCLMFDTYLARQRSESGVRFAEFYLNSGQAPSSGFAGEDLEVVLAHNPSVTRYALLDGYPFPGAYPAFRRLRHDLAITKVWMEAHPREIVTLVMESYFVDPPMMMGEFEAAGLADMIFWADRPNPGFFAPDGTLWEVEQHGWPRVGSMADANRRLVVFSSRGEDGDGLAHQWDYMSENVYGNDSLEPATAAGFRAESVGLAHKGYSLLFVNYFPDLDLLGGQYFDDVNDTVRITACLAAIRDVTSRPPSFVAVDHYHEGRVVAAPPVADSGPLQVVFSLNAFAWRGVPHIEATHTIEPAANAAGWHRTAVRASLDGTTAIGTIDWVEYDIRGAVSESSNANGPLDLDLIADGDYLVNYQVVGSRENRSDASYFRVRIDLGAPVTEAHLTAVALAAGLSQQSVLVSLVAFDPRSGIASTWFRIEDGGATRYTESFELTGAGPVRLYYWSIDMAGNVESEQLVTVSFDAAPPTHTPTTTPTSTPTATSTNTPTQTSTASFTPLPLGAPCSGGSECGSTFCVDGVCCDTACAGPLAHCSHSRNAGMCMQVSPAPALSWTTLLTALLLLMGVAALRLRQHRPGSMPPSL